VDKTKFVIEKDNKTLTMERTFHAPQHKLWKAFAEKEMFEQWFAPEGWEVKTNKFEFVNGSENIYVMTCMDKNQGDWFGKTSSGKMVFKNINPESSFGYTDYFLDDDGNVDDSLPASDSSIELEALADDSTLLRVSTSYQTEAELKQVIEMGMKEGYAMTLDKLEKLITD
jgi:uncharacterized protein YndB with AHSA1/START domain